MNKEEAIQWLKDNYNLSIGDIIKIVFYPSNKTITIKDIKPTDNIGHFRTKYPVVIGIEPVEDTFMAQHIDWNTIESIYGF